MIALPSKAWHAQNEPVRFGNSLDSSARADCLFELLLASVFVSISALLIYPFRMVKDDLHRGSSHSLLERHVYRSIGDRMHGHCVSQVLQSSHVTCLLSSRETIAKTVTTFETEFIRAE